MAALATLNDMVGRLFDPNNHLANLGFGLLQGSGRPGTLGARIGQAGQYASARQDAVLKNELARAKLSEHQRKQALINKLGGLPGIPEEWLPLVQAYPEEVIGPLIMSQFPTPQQRIDMDISSARLRQLEAEAAASEAGPQVATTAALGNISDLVDASERLYKKDSLLVPGGVLDLFGEGGLKLGQAGIQIANQLFGTNFSQQDVADALTVRKATAALAANLQQVATRGTQSATGLRNIQQALGGGAGWPVQRRVMIGELGRIIADVQARGAEDQVPDFGAVVDLQHRLIEEDEAFTREGGDATLQGTGVPDNKVRQTTPPALPPSDQPINRPPQPAPKKDQSRVGGQGKLLNDTEREKLRREITGMQPTPRFETEAEAEAALLRDKVTIPDEGIEIYIGGRKFRVFRSDIGAGQ